MTAHTNSAESTDAAIESPCLRLEFAGNHEACLVSCRDLMGLEEARKALVNRGFSSDEIFILCDHQPLRRDLYARQLFVNAPRRHAFSGRFVGFGALIGAVVLGPAGLIISPVVAMAGAILGVAAGALIGMLLSIDADNRPLANSLFAECRGKIAAETAALAVIVSKADQDASERLDKAEAILSALQQA